MARSNLTLVVLAVELLLNSGASQADPDHSKDLHFAHPLFGESPSPDTKVRADYFFQNESGEATGESHTARFEAEYALRRWVSVEADVPFTVRDPDDESSERHLDTVKIAVKLGGDERGHSTAVIAPGLKLAPTRDQNLKIGVGVGLPISNDKDFHALALFSVFYHF